MTSPVVRLAELVISDPRKAIDSASRILVQHKAKKARARAKSAPRRKAERATKAEHREHTRATRDAVFGQSFGMCEVCRATASDLHHLISGPLRRRFESPHTCVALCATHHALAHRGDLDTLHALTKLTRLDTRAAEALHLRIDKIVSHHV